MSQVIRPDILHLEACNFIDKPAGGQLNFSRQLMKVLGSRLALVGWTNAPDEPVGSWYDKVIDGITYRFFAIGRDKLSAGKPIIPARLKTWLQIKRFQRRIFSINIANILVREHVILMAMLPNSDYNLCYYFPGVEAPLSISRYPLAKRFTRFFDNVFFRSLGLKPTCILAAADKTAIEGLKLKVGENLKGKNIISFPTRVDTDVFHPAGPLKVRKQLGLSEDTIIVTTTCRIHWAKGWQFILEAFKIFLDHLPNSLLIFLGDGSERQALERQALALGIRKNIIVAGYQPPTSIAAYLQSSDLFVMGSLKEGWSTVLVEALACQVPTVTTRFSSADAIVRHGVNGFIVERDAQVFANAMEKALNLNGVSTFAMNEIDRYALKNLSRDLFEVWPLVEKDANLNKAIQKVEP